MELLAILPSDGDLIREKRFYLCPADTIEELANKATPSTSNFGLFILVHAEALDDEDVLQAAKRLLCKGLACLSAWGSDCKRVHDLFDRAALGINSQLSGDDVIMTSWHSCESLEEALGFFIHAGFVTKKFEETCKDWIIAPISNPDWEQSIRNNIDPIIAVFNDDSEDS